MNFLKFIWKKIKELFTKRPPSAEKIIAEAKTILTVAIELEVIYARIGNSEDVNERALLIKQVARQQVAKEIIDFVENDATTVVETKKGKKRLYELHELQEELQRLEEQKAILYLTESKIKTASYPDDLSIERGVNKLLALLNKNKAGEKVQLSSISISTSDKSFEQLERLLKDRSALKRYRVRENKKQTQEKLYKNQIKHQLATLEAYIDQKKISEAQGLIAILSNSIRPNYEKELIRLSKAREKLKEKEHQIFKMQQDEILKQQTEQAKKIRDLQERKIAEQRLAKEQEWAKQKIEEDKLFEKKRKLNALLTRKFNWRDFQRVLQENGITTFYHFTDSLNLKSIKENGGLYSWHYADSNGIIITFPGGDTLSRDLDKRYGLQDFVRVSFCTDHPMQHRLEQRGRSLVLLEVDIGVAYYENSIFCNINATDSSHQKGTELKDLERIKFAATKRRFVSNQDPDFKHHQAEVLVKTWIPLEYISNINNLVDDLY